MCGLFSWGKKTPPPADIIRGEKIEAPRLIGRTTAHKGLKRIWDLVMDDWSMIIGVHGMAGVGKTAIMKNLYNQLLDTQPNQFNDVVWVNKSFWYNLPDEEIKGIEDLLQMVNLKKGRRVLLIVDGFKEGGEGLFINVFNKDTGNKLVLTTRSTDVCTRMGCKEDCIVKVELLSEIEAFELFWDTVKVNPNPTPRMTQIAEEVVKECSRLPLVIIAMGEKFKRKNEPQWAKLFLKMNKSGYGIVHIGGIFGARGYFDPFWEISDGQRDSLYLCALYPKDWKILTKELIEYSQMLYNTLGKKAEKNVMALKSNAYLESVEVDFEDHHEWGEGVQMQPLYRKLAIQRNYTGSIIFKCGLMLKELPEEVEWEWPSYLNMASFMCNNIRTISISPKCPLLHVLFLNKNPDLCTISHRFFSHLTSLKILDLRDNHKLKGLPNSISDLVDLRALRLSRCWSLNRVPSLAKLLHMEMLELDETAIEELPHGIEMLVQLRFLKLHSLRLREPIPSDYLSRLRSLPHLDLHV